MQRIFIGKRENICSATKASRYALSSNLVARFCLTKLMFTSTLPVFQNNLSSLTCGFTVPTRQLATLFDRPDKDCEFPLSRPVASEGSVLDTTRANAQFIN